MYLGRIVELAPSRELNEPAAPVHGRAAVRGARSRTPRSSAAGAGSSCAATCPRRSTRRPGCHFHTRCWLRERLGNPERCSAEVPELRELSTGHEVACHFAEEVDGSPEQIQSTGRGAPGTVSRRGAGGPGVDSRTDGPWMPGRAGTAARPPARA